MRLGTLEPLLSDTPEALYWMGFLLADGYFTESRLKVRLAIKDEQHLQKLGIFLGGVPVNKYISKSLYGEFEAVSLLLMHASIMRKIRTKWGIVNDKTHNPPNLNWLTPNQLIYVLIGFIDGDGHIQKQLHRLDSVITIKNDVSWLDTLQFMVSSLHDQFNFTSPNAAINAKGFAKISICKAEVLRLLKLKSKEIPALERKWSIIDDTYISKNEQARSRKAMFVQLHQQGKSSAEIAALLNMSQSNVCTTIKRLGLVGVNLMRNKES